MNRDDWQNAYGLIPQQLEVRVAHTLAHLEPSRRAPGRSLRTAVIVLALIVALGGVAYALIQSKVADIFGWFYGTDKKETLLSGDIAPSGQYMQLGDVVYRLDEVVYIDGEIYGTGTIQPADGANVVLIPEDYSIHDRAGYLLHYGNETIPDEAPSYAELAEQRGAKLLVATCMANGVIDPDGTLNASEIGYTQLPQSDGSIRFTFEFSGGTIENGRMNASAIDRMQSYAVSLYIANWEMTLDGEWLREAPNDTWLKQDWTITVTPTL